MNVEIKAKCGNQDLVRSVLKSKGADFRGVDHQVDTYFVVPKGRLKLREGDIENSLIYYEREGRKGPSRSLVTLFENPDANLKEILVKALGVIVVVEKQREIYFIDNVKFHIDKVEGLGDFVEVEAFSKDGNPPKERLTEQVEEYMALLQIREEDLVDVSYSDLLLQQRRESK